MTIDRQGRIWTSHRVSGLATARLRAEPPQMGDLIERPRGDHDLQLSPMQPIDEAAAKAAAVLVPIVAREAEEEIGLERRHVEPLGYLDAYLTGTGYRVVPVVALVAPAFSLTLNPVEVDEVFEVPLDFLMDPANHQRHGREFRGVWRTFYAMPHGDNYIWGATAGMIRNLFERMAG